MDRTLPFALESSGCCASEFQPVSVKPEICPENSGMEVFRNDTQFCTVNNDSFSESVQFSFLPPSSSETAHEECGNVCEDVGFVTEGIDPNNYSFKCTKCCLAFRRLSSLSKHSCSWKSHHFLLCSLCGMSFSDRSTLFLHIRKHFPDMAYNKHSFKTDADLTNSKSTQTECTADEDNVLNCLPSGADQRNTSSSANSTANQHSSFENICEFTGTNNIDHVELMTYENTDVIPRNIAECIILKDGINSIQEEIYNTNFGIQTSADDQLKSTRKSSAISKLHRDHGLEHINSRGCLVRARRMGDGCSDDCRFKCHSKISTEERQVIFSEYWGLGNNVLQWAFIAKYTTVYVPKRVTGGRRSASLRYWFEVNGKLTKVCKSMFISTLDISDSLIKTATSKRGLGLRSFMDLRGRNKRIQRSISRRSSKLSAEVSLSKDKPELKGSDAEHSLTVPHIHATTPSLEDNQLHGSPTPHTNDQESPDLNSDADVFPPSPDGHSQMYVSDTRRMTTPSKIFKHSDSRFSSVEETDAETLINVRGRQSDDACALAFSEGCAYFSNDEDQDSSFLDHKDLHHQDVVPNSENNDDTSCNVFPASFVDKTCMNGLPAFSDEMQDCPGSLSNVNNSGTFASKFAKSKMQRNYGFEHVNTRGCVVRARRMGLGCAENCRYKCHRKITDEQRMSIFKEYWGLGNTALQWAFIAKFTTLYAPKKVTGGRRSASRRYWFQIADKLVSVCKSMFVTTLDISENTIKTAILKQCFGHGSSAFSDLRGKHSKKKRPAARSDSKWREEKKDISEAAALTTVADWNSQASPYVSSLDSDCSSSSSNLGSESFSESRQSKSDVADSEYPQVENKTFVCGLGGNSPNDFSLPKGAFHSSDQVLSSLEMTVKEEPSDECFSDDQSCEEAVINVSLDDPFAAKLGDSSNGSLFAVSKGSSSDVATLSEGNSDLTRETFHPSKSCMAKSLRDHGIGHVNSRGQFVRGRKMGPGCGKTCRSKCETKISDDERELIFNEYWALGNNSLQWAYIAERTTLYAPKKVTAGRRTSSRRYWFDVGERLVNVCKSMFLNTLDISDSIINTAILKQNSSLEEIPFVDKRGKHRKRHRAVSLDMQQCVEDHVNSLPRVNWRCCDNDVYKEYLEAKAGSIANMYRLFKNWFEVSPQSSLCKMVTERQYRDIFLKTFVGLSIYSSKRKCDHCKGIMNENV